MSQTAFERVNQLLTPAYESRLHNIKKQSLEVKSDSSTRTSRTTMNPVNHEINIFIAQVLPHWGSTPENQSLSTIIDGNQPVPARACSAASIASFFFIRIIGAACSDEAPSETTSTSRSFDTWLK